MSNFFDEPNGGAGPTPKSKTDPKHQAYAQIVGLVIGEFVRLVILKRSLTRLTGRQYNYRDAYAACALLNAAGSMFESGRNQEAKNRESLKEAKKTLQTNDGK